MSDEKIVAYHPNRSRISDNTLGKFIRSEISGDLLEVPGVGVASVDALKKADISTTHQLLGKYLSLKGEGVQPVELADRFFYWLNSIGTAPGSRSGVVLAVAEKLNLSFNGIYDATAYDEEEEHEQDA